MNRYETEMKDLVKHFDEQTLDALTRLMESMLENQKVIEAERYREMGISPAEAVEIIEKGEAPDRIDVDFCADAMRYYRTKHLYLSPDSLAFWSLPMLLEAGRIMGIRQERARRREQQHG